MPSSRASREAQRPRSQIVGIAQIAARRLGELEQLLPEVLHLRRAVRDVERDQVRERAQRVWRRPAQVLRDLHLELDEQHGELGVEVGERIAGVGVDERRAEVAHRVQALLGDGDQIGLAAVVGREVAAVDADARAAQRAALQEPPVVRRHGAMPATRPNGRQHRAEQDRDVGHGPAHRPGGVLAVRDRDDPVLREQPERRLEPDDEVVAGGADDRPVGLGADRRGAQVRGRRDGRPGARAARVEARAGTGRA